ncbi:hypothetical protein PRNP1_008844 [Phytophthora ramorum]
MAGSDAPSAEDVWQLWSLACVLVQRQLTTQLAQCLEPLCAVDCSSRSAGEQEILAQANVLLAEICVVACSNGKQADNLDLWTRRVIQTEKSIYAVDAAIARGVFCSHESKLRLLKAKFLLQQQLKAERTAKNRRMLEILCEGLRTCAETEGENAEVIAEFREYFGVKLKACLVKMHAATVKAKYVQDNSGINSFAENLKYLRTTLPDYIDSSFLLWLVEVTCQTAISSFQPGSTAEMRQLVDFGQEFFDKVSVEQSVSPEFRLHHLIISGFYYLRTGKSGKVMPLLEEINLLVQGTWNDSDQKPVRVVRETYLDTIRDLMRVSVVACSDPKEALDLAMKAILAAQGNLQIYAQYPAVQLMLIATLFDLLYVYCRLLGLQCRYADMGDSLVQMTTLFATHKVHLQRTIFYRFFLARCHTLIAKYATAIGNIKHARAHLNFVVDKLLPAPTVEEASYPDAYLAVWVDVLEVATYCCGVAATQSFSASGNLSTDVQIKQIYPSRVLLQWVTRVLTMDGLRHHIYKCCSAELRVKYDLALVKWMWATDALSRRGTEEGRCTAAQSPRVTQNAELEELRPKSFTLLHEALQRINASGCCCETTSEIMVLLGPQLASFGKPEQGEEMLRNAIRSTLHSKNVLLQMRLLANIFDLYSSKRLAQAQATAAAKYNKKLGVLQRRIAAAQAEADTTAALMEWSAGSSSTKASTPSRG